MKLLLVLSLLLQTTVHMALAQGEECPLGNAVALQSDGSVTFQHVTNPDESTVTLQLTYEGEAWLSLGPSSNGRMIGSQPVIGLPDEAVGVDNPVVFNLGAKTINAVLPLDEVSQLQDAGILQNDTHTVLTYTMPLGVGAVPLTATGRHTFVWAVGSSNSLDASNHRRRGDFTISLVPCGANDAAGGGIFLGGGGAPNKGLWKAHGILMATAWAILIPLAVGASRLRGFFSSSPGLWFKIHRVCTLTAVLCVLIGFIIAVVAISDQVADGEDAQHFTANKHRKVGLAITVLMVVQVVVAAVRPHPPAAPSTTTTSKDVAASSTSHTPQQDSKHGKADDAKDGSADDEEAATGEVEQPSKSWWRFAWETKHRTFGITLLALAWYNCNLGIDLYMNLFQEGDNASGAFWGVAVSIVGITVILNVVQRVRGSKNSD